MLRSIQPIACGMHCMPAPNHRCVSKCPSYVQLKFQKTKFMCMCTIHSVNPEVYAYLYTVWFRLNFQTDSWNVFLRFAMNRHSYRMHAHSSSINFRTFNYTLEPWGMHILPFGRDSVHFGLLWNILDEEFIYWSRGQCARMHTLAHIAYGTVLFHKYTHSRHTDDRHFFFTRALFFPWRCHWHDHRLQFDTCVWRASSHCDATTKAHESFKSKLALVYPIIIIEHAPHGHTHTHTHMRAHQGKRRADVCWINPTIRVHCRKLTGLKLHWNQIGLMLRVKFKFLP